MYQWYQKASNCYVFLTDLPAQRPLADVLPHCRWFTRGWTLQELLAPPNVEFFNQDWGSIGSKRSLRYALSDITGISTEHLFEEPLPFTSVATKMSWAAGRQTKRIEDKAYSMLGIFDVNMPLIYGEGMKAFRRLQEEIIKRNNDLTILAWDAIPGPEGQLTSPLAPSPAAFAKSSSITKFADDFAEFTVTNKGLVISGDIPLRTASIPAFGRMESLYLLCLGHGESHPGGIVLRKIGPKLFCRCKDIPLAGFCYKVHETHMYDVSETYILIDTAPAMSAALAYRTRGIHVPFDSSFKLRYAYPETLWDETDRMFLRPKRYNWVEFPMVLVMIFKVALEQRTVVLAVLCHHLNTGPVLKIFSQDQYPQEFDIIIQARYREDGIHVQELDLQARSIRAMTNTTRVEAGGQYHQISVSLRPDFLVETFAGMASASTLAFFVDGQETRRESEPEDPRVR